MPLGSTRTMAFSPPSVTHGAPSGPTITPRGAERSPNSTYLVFPVTGSRCPSAPAAGALQRSQVVGELGRCPHEHTAVARLLPRTTALLEPAAHLGIIPPKHQSGHHRAPHRRWALASSGQQVIQAPVEAGEILRGLKGGMPLRRLPRRQGQRAPRAFPADENRGTAATPRG